MASELDGIEIPVPCPECGGNTLKSYGWLKRNKELACSRCDETIQLNDHGFRDALLDAERCIARVRGKPD